jgi:diguanylate cyclase (GGDEF)-like protein
MPDSRFHSSFPSNEISLVEQLQLLSGALEAIRGVAWQASVPPGGVTFVSEQVRLLYGYPRERWLNDPQFHWSIIDPRDRRAAQTTFARAVQSGQPYISEYRVRALGGQMLWVRDFGMVVPTSALAAAAARLPGGAEPIFVHGVTLDITFERKAMLLEQDRNEVLTLVAQNSDLETIFARIVRLAHLQQPEAALVIARPHNLRTLAGTWLLSAPTEVSPTARAALSAPDHGDSGPLGMAAALRMAVMAPDLTSDQLLSSSGLALDCQPWDEVRTRLSASGYRAVWAMPIVGRGESRGVVASLRHEPGMPNAFQLGLLETLARLAFVAMEHRTLTEQLATQARRDALTGLPNRLAFEEQLTARLGELSWRRLQRQQQGGWLALALIDLDGFKRVNDTLGHHVGDLLLQRISERLSAHVRPHDVLARMGGDEFTLISVDLSQPQLALEVAQGVLAAFIQPFVLTIDGNQRELFINASIGLAIAPNDGLDASTLQRKADTAMYRAKALGKNQVASFTASMNAQALEQLEIEHQLRRAIENHELQLHYQPEVDAGGKLLGVEALLRWSMQVNGQPVNISPALFIPIAEEVGLIIPIGTWVLEEACRQCHEWQRQGLMVRVAVNVSPVQFASDDFVDLVKAMLHKYKLAPSSIELELTENVMLQDLEDTTNKLNALRHYGITISVDDFGTGYSSLRYLHKLPIDTVKIDRSFVAQIENPQGHSLTQTIVLLARQLGLKVTAEGVETAQQLALLNALGCDALQGYLIARPMPADELNRRFLQPQ